MNHQILMRDAKFHEATISMRDAKLKQVDDDDDATTQQSFVFDDQRVRLLICDLFVRRCFATLPYPSY